jgi:hypothetical protein
MFRKSISTIAVAATLACLAAAFQKPEEPKRLRVGTYQADSLVVAYYKNSNPYFKKEMDALMAEPVEAREKKGAALQDRAHQQLAGAPIDNILEALRPVLPEIARAAHVDLIVSQIVYRAPDADTVDITGLLIERFHPDENTRRMIRNLHP